MDTGEFEMSRRRAALYILPFVALGVADVLLLVFWGLDPLWGFMILPPIAAISVLGWLAVRGGFARDRVGDEPASGTRPADERDPGY
jgi:cobalamin synthase